LNGCHNLILSDTTFRKPLQGMWVQPNHMSMRHREAAIRLSGVRGDPGKRGQARLGSVSGRGTGNFSKSKSSQSPCRPDPASVTDAARSSAQGQGLTYCNLSMSLLAVSNFVLTAAALFKRGAMLPCSHNKTSSRSISRNRSASSWDLSRADSRLNRMALSCVLFMAILSRS
jgi:hypothetical protein